MLRALGAVVVVAIVAVVALLVFGGDDPQDQSTPTATAQASTAPDFQAEPGATRVRVTDDELTVDPRSVKLQDGYLTLQMENAATTSVELALVKGTEGGNAIVAMPLDRGARRVDQVGLEAAGTYTLLVREPGADDSPGRARVKLTLR